MKKVFLFLLLLVMFLTGCSQESPELDSSEGAPNQTNDSFVDTTTERKIIYTASLVLKGDTVEDTLNKVKEILPVDTWYEKETIYEDRAVLVLRVRTVYFDTFISNLKSTGEVSNLERKANDVTNKYNDLANEKAVLEGERQRLLELMETSSASEIVSIINPRISEINSQLNTINLALSSLDESVEYSTITINITESSIESTFGEKVANAFTAGWEFVKGFFSVLIQVIVWLIPVMIIIVPVGGTAIFVYVRKKKKKQE